MKLQNNGRFVLSPLSFFIGNMFGKCIQYVRIDFYIKKTKKRSKNDGSHAVIVIIVGGKPLITTNKLAGPVGK